jgi:WD40 repeat protein
MQMFTFYRSALSLSAATAILAGCANGENATSTLPGMPADRASAQDLLYAGSNGRAWIFSYPQGQDREKASGGLGSIKGGCADSSGNVYLISLYASGGVFVNVYQHGGTKPIREMVTSWGYACASDPTTGNLAVGTGNDKVAIYRKASGKPKLYSLPANFGGKTCTYDGNGNLFVDGYTTVPALAELPKGGSSFELISLQSITGSANSLGAMRWDGTYLAISDSATTVYRVAVTGTTAQVVGKVQLQGLNVVSSMWIQGDTIVAGGSPNRRVLIWKYPAGGNPIKIIRDVGKDAVVAVSKS